MRQALASDVGRRELLAWAMYDFANSGFTTVVITALFNAYFVAVIAENAPWATFAWTATLSLSYLLVILTAPLLGAYADCFGKRKQLLLLTTIGCSAATAALGFAAPGALLYTIVLLIVANYCFASGENLVAAFLPEIARPQGLGRISGWGWGIGYFGGMLTLGLCLLYLQAHQKSGGTAASAVPGALWITATLFLLGAIPTFVILKERNQTAAPGQRSLRKAAKAAWHAVALSVHQLSAFTDFARFLLASLCYQAGIQAVVALAAIYTTQALGFTFTESLRLILIVNVAAALGAFAFGYLQDRLGHLRVVALTLLGWLIATALLWATPAGSEGLPLFWVAALLIGSVLGASQSAGRALVGLLAPPTRLAQWFGFWGLMMKAAAILGPLTYGTVTWISANDHRTALLITASYFLLGLVLLAGIDLRRGRKAALRAARGDRRSLA